jgi:hypothetical protein
MNSLPWDPSGIPANGYIPFDLHLGPGTLKICDTSCGSFPFVIPRLSRVTGTGRTSDSLASGTVIQAGSSFPTTGKTLVQIGDVDGSASFGTLLSSVTVDCNYVAKCTGLENSSAQEQSGLEHVNVVNYSIRGIYIHGPLAQNSHYTDLEVNGCLIQASCLITTINNATVPLEIDNVPALRPIDGITVNPNKTVQYTITNAVFGTPDTTFTANNSLSSLTGTVYVTISGVNPSGYNGTYKVDASNPTSFQVKIGTNPGMYTSSSGKAAVVPTDDVLVCSDTCPDTGDTASPTPVTFIASHFEHGGFGVDAKGSHTTLDLIGSSCPNSSSSDIAVCAFLEGGASAIAGAHIENFYPGPATVWGLQDDNFSYTTHDSFIQLYDIGAASGSNRTRHCSEPDCPGDQIPSLVLYGSGGTATISTTGTNQQLVLSPPGTGFVEINNAGAAANPSLVLTDPHEQCEFGSRERRCFF